MRRRPNPEYYRLLYAGLDVNRARNQGVGLAADVLRRRLAATGRARLRMCSGSMHPLLRAGARVELRPVAPGEDLTGAIAAVDTGAVVIVHRVTRDAGDQVETRGIARANGDPPWPRSAVIGVASPRWLRPAAAALDVAWRARRAVGGLR